MVLRFHRISIVGVLLVLILAACNGRNSQQANTADTGIEISAESTQVGQTMLSVTLTDADGNPINDATISVKGDMSHAGMMPVLAEVSGAENGVYKLPFEWTMGGDWIVTVAATLPDGRSTSQQFNFTVSK